MSDETAITVYGDTQVARALSPDQAMEQDAAFLATWLHGKAEKTQRGYMTDIRKFYSYVGKPLREVTLADVQDFLDTLTHLKASTQARATAAVKSCFSFAVKTGYLQFNVGAVIKLPKVEDTLAERILSEPQVARLLAREENPRNHAILVLLYRAGLRVHELCNLQWRNLQPRGDTGQVAIFGKGKKTRFILLDRETWEEVQMLHEITADQDTYVFQSRQGRSRTGETHYRMDESTINLIIRRAARRAGITLDVSPHWMRHAHATHALENGAPMPLVKETLGHSSLETTGRYLHVRPDDSSGQYLKV